MLRDDATCPVCSDIAAQDDMIGPVLTTSPPSFRPALRRMTFAAVMMAPFTPRAPPGPFAKIRRGGRRAPGCLGWRGWLVGNRWRLWWWLPRLGATLFPAGGFVSEAGGVIAFR